MSAQQAGWWPVNEGRELGYFDGTVWTGERVPNPDAPAPSPFDRLDWGQWQTWVGLLLALVVLFGVVVVPLAWLLMAAA